MTHPRLAVILLAAAALVYYLWPAGNPDSIPGAEVRAIPSTAQPPPEAPPVDSVDVPASESDPVIDAAEDPTETTATERSRVSGLVRDVSGIPLEGVEIIASNHAADGTELARSSTISDNRGEFTLEQLLPGRQYRLGVTPHDGHAAHELETFVAGQTDRLQDIVMQRVSLVDADGMVVDVDGAPVADFEFVVGSLSTEFPVRVVKSDSTGFFSLREYPAGDIRIATNTSDFFQIEGLELLPDEYRNLTLVIDRGSYHLAGWVSDQTGAPVVEAQIILKSSFKTGDYQSISNRATITDQNGAFEFAQLGGNPATLTIYAGGFETRTLHHRFGSYSDHLRVILTATGDDSATAQ